MDHDQRAAGAAEKDYRLTPAMASRKLQVVSFVHQYIARWGAWPSYGEIGAAMGIHRDTARDAVRRAVRDGLLDRAPGSRKPRVAPARQTAAEAGDSPSAAMKIASGKKDAPGDFDDF